MGKNVLCCPKCKRPVEAKDYTGMQMNRGSWLFGSVLPRISCICGYRGLPISLSMEDYQKWNEEDSA